MQAPPAVVFSFRERMVGPMAQGVDNPRVGAERGRAEGTQLSGNFVITIDDLAACVAAPDHPARLGGTVSFADLAHEAPIIAGTLHLYAPDRETGMKQMRYRLGFRGRDGTPYTLIATKFIRPGRASVHEQVTAYARLCAPADAPAAGAADVTADVPEAMPGRVVAAGVLVFRLRDLPSFLWSMRAEGVSRLVGLRHFLAFSRRELTTPLPALAT